MREVSWGIYQTLTLFVCKFKSLKMSFTLIKKSLEEVDLLKKETEAAGGLREKLHKAKEEILPSI
jgi:hypothetical protein